MHANRQSQNAWMSWRQQPQNTQGLLGWAIFSMRSLCISDPGQGLLWGLPMQGNPSIVMRTVTLAPSDLLRALLRQQDLIIHSKVIVTFIQTHQVCLLLHLPPGLRLICMAKAQGSVWLVFNCVMHVEQQPWQAWLALNAGTHWSHPGLVPTTRMQLWSTGGGCLQIGRQTLKSGSWTPQLMRYAVARQ